MLYVYDLTPKINWDKCSDFPINVLTQNNKRCKVQVPVSHLCKFSCITMCYSVYLSANLISMKNNAKL